MNHKKVLKFTDAIIYGEDSLLFGNWDYNGIYIFNIVTGELKLISYMPEIVGREYNQYQVNNLIQNDNNIFLFMHYGVNAFNIKKDSLQMNIHSFNNDEDRYCTMSQALENHEIVWRIPDNVTGKLYSFDLILKCFTKHSRWEEQIKNYFLSEDDELSQTPFIKDDIIWTCIVGTSTILRYNLINEEMSSFEIENTHITNIYLDDGALWIVQDDQIGLLKYDIEKNIYQNFVYENIEIKRSPFSKIFVYKEYVILLPKYYNKILFFHKENGEFYHIYDEVHNDTNELSARFGNIILNDKMYLFPWGSDNFMVVNMNTLQVEQSIKMSAPKEDYENLIVRKLQNNIILDENEMPLSDFLSGINNLECNREIQGSEVGSKIYEEIKELII